jgi:hypothetical protein
MDYIDASTADEPPNRKRSGDATVSGGNLMHIDACILRAAGQNRILDGN